MATIVSSPWSIIRGSIAGTTYLSGPGHPIIARQRVAPVQPVTNPRTKIKASMATAVAKWDSLTDEVRGEWEAYAQTVTFVGPTGSYSPSGRQLAIGQYIATQYIDDNAHPSSPLVATMADAPVNAGQLATPDITISDPSTGTGFTVACKNQDLETMTFYVTRSLAQSPSRNYYKGPWVPQLSQSDEAVFGASASFDFSAPYDGAVVFIRVRGISSLSPRRMCGEQIIRAVAVTPGP